jgi:K+-sensing histidine kinase KdpD
MPQKESSTHAHIDYNLLSHIAHEVRSPFNGLIGFSDLLSSHGPELSEDRKTEYIHLVNQLTNKSFFQLQTFIAWVKLISNNLQLNQNLSHIRDTVKQAIHYNRNDLDSKNIATDTVYNTDLIRADHIQLSISLGCFLFNAIRTGTERSAITITTGQAAAYATIRMVWDCADTEHQAIRWLLDMPSSAPGYDEHTFRLWIAREIILQHKGSVETDPLSGNTVGVEIRLPVSV